MLQILLPAWTVCLDLFFTAIAYGISGIRISVRAACILSGNGCWLFLGSYGAGKVVGIVSACIVLQAGWCRVTGSYGGSNAIKKLC